MGSTNTAWSNLDTRRRIIVIGASLAVFGAVLMMARSTTSRDLSLLYAGLDNSTAGDVVTSLDQRGVIYEVRGGSIFVPTADRDRLRMTLASEGLPANSSDGYELLDNLSGFGTTSQMFDAAYWRAKEGELARTILASPHIRAARVHISATSAQPFRREQSPTAAVTVTTVNGTLDVGQADALRFLVASAVPGLSPNDVAVIDGVGGLVSGNDQRAITPDANEKVAELRNRVERLLAARVGPGNAVVEVSVDTITETESIIERRFDPETRVAISTEVLESSTSSQDSMSGDVTIASNLPEGDGAGSSGAATNENSESRSVTNYEVSETQREVLRTPGAVRRISVAVLVNGIETIDDEGVVVVSPRPAEELEDLSMLVASAVGLDADRGDEITIRSMVFEALPELGTAAGEAPDLPAAPLNIMKLVQTGVLGLVALILGLFVVRPVLTARHEEPALLDNSGGNVTPMVIGANGSVIDGTSAPTAVQNNLENQSNKDEAASAADEDPVQRLRGLIDDRRDEAIQVLQSWIEDPSSEPAK
ncbi:flagellar basal-body MS-ring/collar protein FliF [Octadecabacter sp. 1_MG-2023]|uniref:flagellar basal-body MS-ring/collar protein FliF n=1 Tax=unclassified Octadecabacter TaxID=196158 RepID=UPI001C0A5602|nr:MULTISPECIES: flagellar basal-body MS-ring/collar protein FliF [unclassified Octadecabacter]MBU2992372.1 flagellar M-ring protein FliF [Octadecabacter sp. B2R22]MDO6734871.1 flagellar basal-body MS-ring/collar protein FliF [Octadecabacter sp. 1_MG-2023]